MRKGDYNRAIQDLTAAIRLHPDNARAFNNRALAYRKQGNLVKARQDQRQAARLTPSLDNELNEILNRTPEFTPRVTNWNFKNIALLKDRSIEEYSLVLLREPNNANVYNERGLAYLEARDYDRAIQDFAEALRIQPNFAEAQKNLEKAKQAKAGSKQP